MTPSSTQLIQGATAVFVQLAHEADSFFIHIAAAAESGAGRGWLPIGRTYTCEAILERGLQINPRAIYRLFVRAEALARGSAEETEEEDEGKVHVSVGKGLELLIVYLPLLSSKGEAVRPEVVTVLARAIRFPKWGKGKRAPSGLRKKHLKALAEKMDPTALADGDRHHVVAGPHQRIEWIADVLDRTPLDRIGRLEDIADLWQRALKSIEPAGLSRRRTDE